MNMTKRLQQLSYEERLKAGTVQPKEKKAQGGVQWEDSCPWQMTKTENTVGSNSTSGNAFVQFVETKDTVLLAA